MISLFDNSTNERVGAWFVNKYREQARVAGHAAAARNLRKMGVPVEMARDIILGPSKAEVVAQLQMQAIRQMQNIQNMHAAYNGGQQLSSSSQLAGLLWGRS